MNLFTLHHHSRETLPGLVRDDWSGCVFLLGPTEYASVDGGVTAYLFAEKYKSSVAQPGFQFNVAISFMLDQIAEACLAGSLGLVKAQPFAQPGLSSRLCQRLSAGLLLQPPALGLRDYRDVRNGGRSPENFRRPVTGSGTLHGLHEPPAPGTRA